MRVENEIFLRQVEAKFAAKLHQDDTEGGTFSAPTISVFLSIFTFCKVIECFDLISQSLRILDKGVIHLNVRYLFSLSTLSCGIDLLNLCG